MKVQLIVSTALLPFLTIGCSPKGEMDDWYNPASYLPFQKLFHLGPYRFNEWKIKGYENWNPDFPVHDSQDAGWNGSHLRGH